MDIDPWAIARAAADELRAHTGIERHDVAIVLGSGWDSAVDALGARRAEVALPDLSGFPVPTVAGHRGVVTSVDSDGQELLVFQGRSHLYEGHDPSVVVHGVRAAVFAGCRVVVLTNAAGTLRPEFPVGGPVLISDHLNLTGRSPLSGPPPPDGIPSRFVDLTDLYSRRLRALAHAVDPSINEGVYCGLGGPHYETPAEIRMLRTMGADLVGMSTVLEAIAAHHLGAEVLAFSLVSNVAAGMTAGHLDHREVLAVGAAGAEAVGQLIRTLVQRL
jgi:purine-nucleoside phosphorylase